MNTFEKIVVLLQYNLNSVPEIYGIFHIVSLIVVGLTTFFISYKYKNCTEKQYKKIVLIFLIIIVILEAFKQLIYSFSYDEATNTKSWSYQWYSFPYQFCSSPYFIFPLIILVKDSRFKDMLLSFTSTFILFAGLSVMLYPNGVFIRILFIDIQTMIHHGTQVVIGIFTIVHIKNRINLKYFIKSLPVFACMAIVAILLDETIPLIVDTGLFNMWFISRHFECSLPVLNMVWTKVPYIVFLLIYFIGFTLLSFMINGITCFILNMSNRKCKN